ncbi:MAG: LysR family transcriptional regulator [Pseudomonadota bacterium]
MDMKQGDFGLLVALDALLEHESVSRAADKLGISQPAMSAQLKRLRSLFNDPLLITSGRRLVATSRARALQADLRRHLQHLDALVRENEAFDPARTRKTFRMVATDYVHLVLAARLDERIRQVAPDARLAFLPFEPRIMWETLEGEAADLALVTGMDIPDAISRHALTERFCVIMRRGHRLEHGKLTLDAFCAERHILISPEGGGFVGATDKALAGLGLKRRVAVSLPSFLLAPGLVAGSDALCVVPRRLAALYREGLVCRDLPFDMSGFSVEMLWHPRRQNDPAHIWFRSELASLTREI